MVPAQRRSFTKAQLQANPDSIISIRRETKPLPTCENAQLVQGPRPCKQHKQKSTHTTDPWSCARHRHGAGGYLLGHNPVFLTEDCGIKPATVQFDAATGGKVP